MVSLDMPLLRKDRFAPLTRKAPRDGTEGCTDQCRLGDL